MATRDLGIPGGRITHVVFAVLALVGLTTALEGSAPGPAALVAFAQEGVTSVPKAEGCLACHQGIEDMHPWLALSCVDCHGGDASAKSKHDAHVHSMGTSTRRTCVSSRAPAGRVTNRSATTSS